MISACSESSSCFAKETVKRKLDHSYKGRPAKRTKRGSICTEEELRATAAAFNFTLFDNRIPMKSVLIKWEKRLRTAAGKTKYWQSKGECLIELNPALLDTEAKFNNTLVHEMCHVAVFLVDGDPADSHGPKWQRWVQSVQQKDAGLDIKVYHHYRNPYDNVYVCSDSYLRRNVCCIAYGSAQEIAPEALEKYRCRLCCGPLMKIGCETDLPAGMYMAHIQRAKRGQPGGRTHEQKDVRLEAEELNLKLSLRLEDVMPKAYTPVENAQVRASFHGGVSKGPIQIKRSNMIKHSAFQHAMDEAKSSGITIAFAALSPKGSDMKSLELDHVNTTAVQLYLTCLGMVAECWMPQGTAYVLPYAPKDPSSLLSGEPRLSVLEEDALVIAFVPYFVPRTVTSLTAVAAHMIYTPPKSISMIDMPEEAPKTPIMVSASLVEESMLLSLSDTVDPPSCYHSPAYFS